MSDRPPEYDPSPEFGWSLPAEDSPLPPPPPVTVVPHPAPPMPPPAPPQTTGFGGPPGAYIPGPTVPDPTMPDSTNPDPRTSSPIERVMPAPIPEPKPLWKQWWFIAAALIVLIGGGALIVSSTAGDDDDETADTRNTDDTRETDDTRDTRDSDETSPTSPPDTVPDFTVATIPDFTIPAIPGFTVPEIPDISVPEVPGSTPPAGDLPVVGETITLDDGTAVRVNSVTHDAPPAQDFFPTEDGNVLTRIDFEVCAGTEGFSALNPLYWTGTLADGAEAEAFLFSFPILVLELAPGACARSQVDLQAPADQVVATVGVRDSIFTVTAEWRTGSSAPVDAPLVASAPVAVVPVGTTVQLAAGGTATVRSVTPGSEPLEPSYPPDPGYQYVRIDAEICAGPTTPSALTAQNFFGVTTDNRLGGASYYGTTFTTEPIAAGQCASGLIDLAVPDPGTVGDIVLSDEQYAEAARWRVG